MALTYTYLASEVTYVKNGNVTTVENVLNDLYANKEELCANRIDIANATFKQVYRSDRLITKSKTDYLTTTTTLEKGKYLIFGIVRTAEHNGQLICNGTGVKVIASAYVDYWPGNGGNVTNYKDGRGNETCYIWYADITQSTQITMGDRCTPKMTDTNVNAVAVFTIYLIN